MHNKKFTLIELLVVVAVIGILASLLLPSLSKAREKAKMAVCKSNMKQLHVAYQLYADDNDGYFPTNEGYMSWNDKLNTYDGRNVEYADLNLPLALFPEKYNSGIYACPDDEVQRWYSLTEGTGPKALTLSYALTRKVELNGTLTGNNRGITGFSFNASDDPQFTSNQTKFTQVSQPSQTISTFEYMSWDRCLGRDYLSQLELTEVEKYPENVPHEGLNKANYLFVDGHVNSLRFFFTMARNDGGMGSVNDHRQTMWDAYK